MKKMTGGCLCGSLRYSCAAEPLQTAVCHCGDCQRQSGSAFSIFVVVPKDSVTFEDETTRVEYSAEGDSGSDVRRVFCGNCGTPILSLLASAPDVDIIKAGTLDERACLQPAAHFWCQSAQPWVTIDKDIPCFERNPD